MDDSFSSGDIAAVESELSGSASASDAPPASEPSAIAAATPTPADATVPPVPQPEPEADPASAQGPIPYDRHKATLDNARTKARDEALAEWRQTYGWAEQIDRAQLEEWTGTARQMASDPVGFVKRMIGELQQHPQYSQQLRSYAASVLSQRTASAEPEPDIDVMDQDGRPTGTRTYSATQLAKWRDWNNQQVLSQVDERFAPLQQHMQTEQERAREAETTRVVGEYAQKSVAEAQNWWGFTDYKPQIKAAMQANPSWDLRQAYMDVLHTQILPRMSQTARTQVLADINAKATATTASPQRPGASTPVHDADRDMADIIREEAQRRGMTL